MKATNIIYKLVDATEPLYDKILNDTGITPQSVHYENHTKIIGFLKLDGSDFQKNFDNLMSTYKPLSDFAQEEIVMGKEALQEKYLHLYPKYKGLQKYNLGLVQKSYTTDTYAFCEKIGNFLETK